METTIGILDHDIEEIMILLNTLLAGEFVFFTKTSKTHCNVNGADFHKLHGIFENQTKQLVEIIDEIAERIRSFSHLASYSPNDNLVVTHIDEEKLDFSNPTQTIQTLVNDHEIILRITRNNASLAPDDHKNLGTTNPATYIMGNHNILGMNA